MSFPDLFGPFIFVFWDITTNVSNNLLCNHASFIWGSDYPWPACFVGNIGFLMTYVTAILFWSLIFTILIGVILLFVKRS